MTDFKTSEQWASNAFFHTKKKDIPPLANKYTEYLCSLVGLCGETVMTGMSHYAQEKLGLRCSDDAYLIDEAGKKWFEENA